ncbi:ATP-binding protein [Streptomyces thermolineatus]|uniref:ATP-binding protein n=1 Tax=Streptomyces thermolineatus TaxID=44033 RepID=UPI00384B52AF
MITDRSKTCALELDALPSRIGQVRRIVSAQLRYWDLVPLIDPALLGVTELLANVHRHARPNKRCTVEMDFADSRLTVAVRDGDPRLPTARMPDPTATSGRGIAMIAALSEAWGARAEAERGGKVVWFMLRERRPRLRLAEDPSALTAVDALAEPTAPAEPPVAPAEPLTVPAEPLMVPVESPVGVPLESPVEIPVGAAAARQVVTVA